MDEDERNALDYQQTTAYFHALHDVRFKLLGLLPVFSGAALAFVPQNVARSEQLGIACLGAIVTLGLMSYDQRNTQIYDRLICRAKFLEWKLRLHPLPGDASGYNFGGPFHARPKLHARPKPKGVSWFALVWHIQGLRLVYAASFTAWTYLGMSPFLGPRPRLLATFTALSFVAAYVALLTIGHTHWTETRDIGSACKDAESETASAAAAPATSR